MSETKVHADTTTITLDGISQNCRKHHMSELFRGGLANNNILENVS
jgi:hypothetical protein